MVRITRRDFLKYCSVAAGALGLSASTLMKVENVLAANGATDVIWISGSACTGCTMSLLNSVFYTTIDDLLLNRINLAYLDTAMATAGAYVDGVQWSGANSVKAAQDIYNNSAGFVLVVEGAIPTGKPTGGAAGDFCRIGKLTTNSPAAPESVMDNVAMFAQKATCLAVLCVGTCSSFGGVPGARGNVTGAKGVAWTGTTPGGATVTNTPSGRVTAVIVTNAGTGYTSATTAATLTNAAGDTTGSGALATAYTDYRTVTGVALPGTNSGYTTIPLVEIAAPTLGSVDDKQAYATAVINVATGVITGFNITNPGYGYIVPAPAVTITNTVLGTSVASTATVGAGSIKKVVVDDAGSGYTAAPTVSFSGTGAAYAAISIAAGDVKNKTGIAAKVINIPGCPPHPDWIVGTIAHILDTNVTLPPVTNYYRPVDYGYGEYQCNAGPCPWRYNNSSSRPDPNARYPEGNSKALGKYKYGLKPGADVLAQGCLGILGCKGRKTKADCSRRRWNADAAETYGVNWCVGSRAGCHGCTEPTFPDKVGKFFTFI